MEGVHIGNVIEDLIDFYKPILDVKLDFETIYDQILAFGEHAHEQFQAGDHRSMFEFNNYNPKYIGKSTEDNIKSNPTKQDFLETAANCFSFKSLAEAETKGHVAIDVPFEKSIDTMLAGNIENLKELIGENPDLLSQNSQYAHKAGLIHYLGSNGVEAWRQVVPMNIVDILKLLIEKGAKPNMWNNIYGSPSTLKGLVETSAHPYQAGLTQDIIKLL